MGAPDCDIALAKDFIAPPGFSLHAGTAGQPSNDDKLERLARYISRPPPGGWR